MKKMLFIAVMAIMAMNASAQREVGSLTIQPKVGYNGSIMFMDDKNIDYEAFNGFNAGVEVEYRTLKWLGLSAGVQYSQEGGKTKIKDINVIEKANLDYINVPIIANFYVWKGLALKVGVQPSFKVREKIEHGKAVAPVDAKYAFGEKAENFDIKIPFGISYDFGPVTTEIRFTSGTLKAFEHKDYYGAALQLNLGYKFVLK